MSIKRGNIVLLIYPHSNLQTYKHRPALVVQADNLNTGLSQLIVACITSNTSRAGHASRVTILLNEPNSHRTGLLQDSVIMADNLATVAFSCIKKPIGEMFDMQAVDNALRKTLGL